VVDEDARCVCLRAFQLRNGWRIWQTLSPVNCCPLAQFLKVDRRLRTAISMNNWVSDRMISCFPPLRQRQVRRKDGAPTFVHEQAVRDLVVSNSRTFPGLQSFVALCSRTNSLLASLESEIGGSQ
jgi:hypothetical protein